MNNTLYVIIPAASFIIIGVTVFGLEIPDEELEAVLGVRTFRGGRGGIRGRVSDLDMDCNQEEISALISGRLTYICVPAWRLID